MYKSIRVFWRISPSLPRPRRTAEQKPQPVTRPPPSAAAEHAPAVARRPAKQAASPPEILQNRNTQRRKQRWIWVRNIYNTVYQHIQDPQSFQ